VVVRLDELPYGSEDPGSAAGLAAAPAPLDTVERSGSQVDAAAAESASRARRGSRALLVVVATLLALLVATLAAGAFYLSTIFYIGVDDGRLVIYSGVPKSVGPLPLHAVYRRSVVTYDSLPAESQTIVDEQKLRDRETAIELSDELGMWP